MPLGPPICRPRLYWRHWQRGEACVWSSLQPFRGQHGNTLGIKGRGGSDHQIAKQLRGSRCRLETISALARAPDECWVVRVWSKHQSPVWGKTAQAGPSCFDTFDYFGHQGFVACQTFCQNQIVGIGILRWNWVCFGWRDQQFPGIGFGVPRFTHAKHHGPARHIMASGGGQSGHRPAARRDTDRWKVSKSGDFVDPGPCSINQIACFKTLTGGDDPMCVFADGCNFVLG